MGKSEEKNERIGEGEVGTGVVLPRNSTRKRGYHEIRKGKSRGVCHHIPSLS
jgi:hypothetical protein